MTNKEVIKAWVNGEANASNFTYSIHWGRICIFLNYWCAIATQPKKNVFVISKKATMTKYRKELIKSLPDNSKIIYCYYNEVDFTCPSVRVAYNFGAFAKDMQTTINKLNKARNPEKYIKELQTLYKECEDYAKHMKKVVPKHVRKYKVYLER